jgi:hypothetical protein
VRSTWPTLERWDRHKCHWDHKRTEDPTVAVGELATLAAGAGAAVAVAAGAEVAGPGPGPGPAEVAEIAGAVVGVVGAAAEKAEERTVVAGSVAEAQLVVAVAAGGRHKDFAPLAAARTVVHNPPVVEHKRSGQHKAVTAVGAAGLGKVCRGLEGMQTQA